MFNDDPMGFQIYFWGDDKGWWLCIRNCCLLDGPVNPMFFCGENLGSQGLQKGP